MRWIVLDIALACLALGVLAAVGLSLWRRVKALSRQLAAAGEAVGAAMADLDAGAGGRIAGGGGRVAGGGRPVAGAPPGRPFGVRSDLST